AGRFAPAVALALEGLQSRRPTTDLLHSRLVARKPARVSRMAVWGTVTAVVLAGGIAFAVFDLSSQRAAVAAAKKDLAGKKQMLDQAKVDIERIKFAKKWTATEPQTLALVRDLT